MHLVPKRLPQLDTIATEELHDVELLHLAPEWSVVSKGHVGTVVGEVAYGYVGCLIGEDVVVNLKDLSCCVWVGNDHMLRNPILRRETLPYCLAGFTASSWFG